MEAKRCQVREGADRGPFVAGTEGVATIVDSYLRFDAAVHWAPSENLPTVSFVGQNLLDDTHVEAHEALVRPFAVEITRSWYIRLTQEF